ncbi:hypothetical protein OHC33_010915 [Knufia fluminis]|uniref:RNA ligase domain-containing protein n=1 Tax=Knufia fluminis TaxID=191047 RepID=A0AAN8E7P7_9EURO|nr:hypothetical protein OHC33_010915 [Knufia fluminis]
MQFLKSLSYFNLGISTYIQHIMTSSPSAEHGLPRPKDNLFPKISGKHEDFLSQLQKLKYEGKLPPTLEVEGTVKLHGMHADIVYDLHDEFADEAATSKSILFQSRNRICAADENQQGWPRDIAQFPDALTYLKTRVLTRFEERNPDKVINKAFPLIIAGEWIGGRVQRGVGLAELSNRFVILSIQLNGLWQKDEDYADIEAEKAAIYSVFRARQTKLKFDTSNITADNPTLFEMQRLADEVEKACPFAAAFGIKNSRGEGVVWKPGVPEARADAKYWLKTKGPICGKENRIDPAKIAADAARNLTIGDAATRWVTPRRIEQGFEYLLEMNMDPHKQACIKEYINWIVNDVLVEEHSEIARYKNQFADAEQAVKKKVGYLARNAFLEKMKEFGADLA